MGCPATKVGESKTFTGAGCWTTLRVKGSVVDPSALVMVSVNGYVPAVPLAADPEMVADPSPWSAKPTPAGRAPWRLNEGAG